MMVAPIMAFAPTARLSQHPDALATEVGGVVVILHTETGVFHQLNGVGSYLWSQISDPIEFETLGRKAALFFDADPAVCARDIDEFVQALDAQGLVVIEP
jgi:hypothetical protein